MPQWWCVVVRHCEGPTTDHAEANAETVVCLRFRRHALPHGTPERAALKTKIEQAQASESAPAMWSRRCTARGAASGGRRHAHLQAPRRRQPRVQRDGGTDVGERRRRDVVRRTRARWLHGRQGRAVTRQPSAVSPARVRQASCHIMSIIFYTDTEKSVYVCACVIRADSVSTCQNSSSQPSSPSESYSSESPNPYPSSSLQSSSSS